MCYFEFQSQNHFFTARKISGLIPLDDFFVKVLFFYFRDPISCLSSIALSLSMMRLVSLTFSSSFTMMFELYFLCTRPIVTNHLKLVTWSHYFGSHIFPSLYNLPFLFTQLVLMVSLNSCGIKISFYNSNELQNIVHGKVFCPCLYFLLEKILWLSHISFFIFYFSAVLYLHCHVNDFLAHTQVALFRVSNCS